jgi:hypothetical protein
MENDAKASHGVHKVPTFAEVCAGDPAGEFGLRQVEVADAEALAAFVAARRLGRDLWRPKASSPEEGA